MPKPELNKKDNNTGTETYLAVDDEINLGYTPEAMQEGYAASSGIRPEIAESSGQSHSNENADESHNPERKSSHLENENAGLADC